MEISASRPTGQGIVMAVSCHLLILLVTLMLRGEAI